MVGQGGRGKRQCMRPALHVPVPAAITHYKENRLCRLCPSHLIDRRPQLPFQLWVGRRIVSCRPRPRRHGALGTWRVAWEPLNPAAQGAWTALVTQERAAMGAADRRQRRQGGQGRLQAAAHAPEPTNTRSDAVQGAGGLAGACLALDLIERGAPSLAPCGRPTYANSLQGKPTLRGFVLCANSRSVHAGRPQGMATDFQRVPLAPGLTFAPAHAVASADRSDGGEGS